MNNDFDVKEYTDEQLFQILDLNNPSDRELEAKIVNMVRKYSYIGNESGEKLSKFFTDIYNHFFENDEEDNDTMEGGNKREPFSSSIQDGALSNNMDAENVQLSSDLSITGNNTKFLPPANNVALTKQLEYSKDQLNPLLKQTIKRIISIDSQYRNQQTRTPSTNFTFNLSEPLRDVVSLSLYSVQIPYTWYTVNSDFGGNFFYLKGNSPGIINGLHDYKIEIPSGNYAPFELAAEVNKSVQNLADIYTDVSFGNTKAVYNNEITNPNSGTGKCTLNIDIKKIYNECNYTLNFPNWETPLDSVLRLNTIASYLGFNNTEYYCSSIYSEPFFLISDKVYPILSTLSSFKIVPYLGNTYLTADISYSPIIVSLDFAGSNEINISNSAVLMDTALKNNIYLDPEFSECTLVQITNPVQYSYGKSYIKMSCKVNNKYLPIMENIKLAVVFPYDLPSKSIFYGANSFFAFNDSVKDASNNVVCELNELLSETPILQSSYDANNTSIVFQCDASGYTSTYNDISISLNNTNYTLNTLLKTINTNIFSVLDLNKQYLKGNISFYSDRVTNKIKISTQIDNTFDNSYYSIYATVGSANLPKIFNLPSSANNTVANSSYNNSDYVFTATAFNANDVIYIRPISQQNQNANPFKISFDTQKTYSNGLELANYLTDRMTTYVDPDTGLYPLIGSKVSYTVNSGFTLELNILLHINQFFYSLKLNSANNIWTKLSFDNVLNATNFTYKLSDYFTQNYIIESNKSIKDNVITIHNGLNDKFFITPSNKIDVFNTSGNTYLITVKIPDNTDNGEGTQYGINELLSLINGSFPNTIADGTSFLMSELDNGETYIKCRFNIKKVFGTKDYRLVFYDPFSFASCFLSNKRSTSTSLQNATWDTTLGWLLGYRNQIYYDLSEFIDVLKPKGTTDTSIYYLNDSSNNCVLIGDTNVSTNLYNYFLIMLDDYVQNHLNDGLVTITNQETSVNHGPFVNVCDPVTGEKVSIPADYLTPEVKYTSKQLYAFNQQVQSQIVKEKSYSKGPFVKDIFGIIPVKTSGMQIGSVYVEFGGSLQNQQRLYFGPVNIHRMTIKLLNDRGNLVDLNNANWSFSFICEQLYKSGVS